MKKLLFLLLPVFCFGQSTLKKITILDPDMVTVSTPAKKFGQVVQYIDGTLSSTANEFIDKSGNGYNLDIINRDFNTNGFPYKSVAMVAQKAANWGKIPDVNNFWFTVGGTPNQISVVSLFQNIEYANQIFTRHQAQLTNPTGEEYQEPKVMEIVTYSIALTGAGLTNATAYFGVPSEVVSNVKWVDPVNGNNSNSGTKASPYLTIAKSFTNITTGGTIYLKNGAINANLDLEGKGFSLIGTGLCTNSISGTGLIIANTVNSDLMTVQGITFNGGNLGVRILANTTAGFNILKCKIAGSTDAVYNQTQSNTTTSLVKNCVLQNQVFCYATLIQVNTCYMASTSAASIRTDKSLLSSNNKYIGTSALGLVQMTIASPSTVNCTSIGDVINGNFLTDVLSSNTGTISIKYAKWTPSSTGGFLQVITNSNPLTDFNISNNVFTQTYFSSCTGVAVKGGNVIFNNNTYNQHNGYLIQATAQAASKTATISGNSSLNNAYSGTFYTTDYTTYVYNNILTANASVQIRCDATSYTNSPCYIHDNYMSNQTDGLDFVVIGTEYSTTKGGYMDGGLVYNNTFLGPVYFGNTSPTQHALFVWSNKVDWYNNYINGCLLGIVQKSNGGTYASKVYSNVLVNCNGALIVKGYKGSSFIGNTIININQTSGYGFLGTAETNTAAAGNSGNSTIKNNIFANYSSTASSNSFIQFDDATQEVGCVSDYNVFYNAISGNIGRIVNTFYNLTNWKLQGFDANSIEQNPNLVNYSYPSPKISNGTTLASPYDYGLDITTDFKAGSVALPVIVTKQQSGTWQNGAYVQ